MTGATIQVASEMLPNSTERAVTISGSSEAITKCIYQICCVMMESPPKGATIPYRPKPAMPPVIFAGGQAYTIQGQYAIPHPDVSIFIYLYLYLYFISYFPITDPHVSFIATFSSSSNLIPIQLTKLHQLALQHAPLVPGQATFGALSPQGTNRYLIILSFSAWTKLDSFLRTFFSFVLDDFFSFILDDFFLVRSWRFFLFVHFWRFFDSFISDDLRPWSESSSSLGNLGRSRWESSRQHSATPSTTPWSNSFTSLGRWRRRRRRAIHHVRVDDSKWPHRMYHWKRRSQNQWDQVRVSLLGLQDVCLSLSLLSPSLFSLVLCVTSFFPSLTSKCYWPKTTTSINRQLSGASIKISNTEEGSKERTVVISGTPESINLATYLINTR